jgi:hypothetical protein
MDLLQRNRQYRLIVGDYNSGDALEITDLQVQFDISKSTDNKKRTNSASIEVTNLSFEHIKLLDTDYPAAVFLGRLLMSPLESPVLIVLLKFNSETVILN